MVSDTNYVYSFYILMNMFYPILNRNIAIIVLNILISIIVGTKMVIFMAIFFFIIIDYKKIKELYTYCLF